MKQFFDDYFNIKKMIRNKHEYKEQMQRVKALPEDYRYVFKQIQKHMWQFASGSGYDMMKVQCDLIDLFEEGVTNGKKVLEITGKDVASFVEELLKNTKTYTQDWKNNLNNKINDKLKNEKNK